MRRLPRQQPLAPPELVAIRREARLVRSNGRLVCMCPYLCDVTCEVCEFDDLLTLERTGR